MLKINSRNQKLNQRRVKKETVVLFQHLFGVFFNKKKIFSGKAKSLRKRFCSQLIYWNKNLLIKSPFTKTRTICFLTGRSRSVYRSFHLSRLKLREFAAAGYFSGLSKSSW